MADGLSPFSFFITGSVGPQELVEENAELQGRAEKGVRVDPEVDKKHRERIAKLESELEGAFVCV